MIGGECIEKPNDCVGLTRGTVIHGIGLSLSETGNVMTYPQEDVFKKITPFCLYACQLTMAKSVIEQQMET